MRDLASSLSRDDTFEQVLSFHTLRNKNTAKINEKTGFSPRARLSTWPRLCCGQTVLATARTVHTQKLFFLAARKNDGFETHTLSLGRLAGTIHRRLLYRSQTLRMMKRHSSRAVVVKRNTRTQQLSRPDGPFYHTAVPRRHHGQTTTTTTTTVMLGPQTG